MRRKWTQYLTSDLSYFYHQVNAITWQNEEEEEQEEDEEEEDEGKEEEEKKGEQLWYQMLIQNVNAVC